MPRERCSMGGCHDDGTPSRVCVGLLYDGGGVRSNDATNGHEEAEMQKTSQPMVPQSRAM